MGEIEDREMTTEERERVLLAGAMVWISELLDQGHDLYDLLDMVELSARTMIVEELARLEMI